MIKIGSWLDRCDEVGLRESADYNSFRAMYLEDGDYKDWKEVVEAYGNDHITTLTFDTIRHIVVLEIYDGSINQTLSLKDNTESFVVYAGVDQGIINTSGSAFIQCMRDGKEIAVFHVVNSPFDVQVNEYGDGWQEFTGGRDEFSHDIALQEFKQHLIDNGVDAEVTKENTLFIAEL